MDELQPIIVFHGRHIVRHLAICNRICVKLLQLMSGVISHNSVKIEVSILINGRCAANYSVSLPPFCPPSWNLSSDLCKTLTGYVRYYSEQFKKNDVSISNRFPGVHKRGIHTDTLRHTHDDIIRRNAMHCISPKNRCLTVGECLVVTSEAIARHDNIVH